MKHIKKYYRHAAVALVLFSGYHYFHHPKHNPFVQVLQAQSLPITVHAEWNKNPEADVVQYNLQLDNGTVIPIANTLDISCNCIKSGVFTINDNNTHVFTLKAQNSFGLVSPASTFSFAVKTPVAPAGGTVKLGA